MRQIDWDSKLSSDDVAWIRQAGIRFGPNGQPIEDAIRDNLGRQYAPTEDEGNDPSRSVQDPAAGAGVPFANLTEDEQRQRLAANSTVTDVEDDDDYDEWKKDELVGEITERNKDRDQDNQLSAIGTKAELIARLRADDETRSED